MKLFQKKSKSFYVLLTLALFLPAVMPDKLTPKASAIVMLSASWGAGAVTWAGPAITAALVGLFFADKVSNRQSDTTTQGGQQSVYQTQDDVGLKRNLRPHHQANSGITSHDASLQQGIPISSSDAVACMKELLIGGKSLLNAYNSFGEDTTYSDLDHSTSKHVDNHYSRSADCEASRKLSFSSKDFLECICPDWSSKSYERYLIQECGFSRHDSLDQQLSEHIKRDLFQNLELYKRPGYIKFLATLTCPKDLQRTLICTESLYKHAYVLELYKTFDCYEQYLPILLEKTYPSKKWRATPLGRKVYDICMKKIEVTEWDSLVTHEACKEQALSQVEARALALQKFRPELLDRWRDLRATCADFDSLFSENFFRPGKYHKVSRSVRKMTQGHGVKVDGKILQSDTLKSRLQVGILRLLEEVHTFYNKNRKNPAMRVVVPYVEKFLVHALSHANKNNLDSSFGLFNCGFVTFKVLTGSQSDGLSYGIGALLPGQVKQELYTLYCLYPNAQFKKLLTTLDSFNGYYQEFAEQLGVIGKNTAEKEQFAHDLNEYIQKNGLWDQLTTAEERAAFDIRDVVRNDLKQMGIDDAAQAQALREHQHTTTDPPKIQYEYHGKDIIEYADDSPSGEREPTAAELIAERDTQKELQQKKEMLQQPIASIVHPTSADCTQKTSNQQTNQTSHTTQSVQKTDDQTVSESDLDSQTLHQAVCGQVASDYQKGLELYGDRLTDAQRTRFQNRRDAFLEISNNPNQKSEYNYSLPIEAQQLFHSVGINVDQFMHGFGGAVEKLVREEQHQIAERYQEFATQMPAGKSRDFVLSEILTKVHIASNLQQCGMHQLSLIPIDQSWMLIDSIDQYGFNFINQSFMQKIEENRHVDWSAAASTVCSASGNFAYDVATGIVVGSVVNPVVSVYHLLDAVVHDPIGKIKTCAALVNNGADAHDLLIASRNKRLCGATLTLLACGVPESALKDQLAHWSEQNFTDAREYVQKAEERLHAFAENPLVQGICAAGSNLSTGATEITDRSYNILYGLCCMEAACKTYDKDHEIALFKQGEKLLQENLPSVYHTAEFAGEMLFWHYGPGLARKHLGAAYEKVAGKFAKKLEQVPRSPRITGPALIRPLTKAEMLEVVQNAPTRIGSTALKGATPVVEEAIASRVIAPLTQTALPAVIEIEAEAACAALSTAASKQIIKVSEKTAEKLRQVATPVQKGALECVEASGEKTIVSAVKKTVLLKVVESAQEITPATVITEKDAAGCADLVTEKSAVNTVKETPLVTATVPTQENMPAAAVEEVVVKSITSAELFKRVASVQKTEIGPELSVNGHGRFGMAEFKSMMDTNRQSKLGILDKMSIREFEKELKLYCEYWNNEFRQFMEAHPEALESLSNEVSKNITKNDLSKGIINDFDFSHMFIPVLKKGRISGYHMIDCFPEAVREIIKVYKKSVEAVVAVTNTKGRAFSRKKTLFPPGTTRQEIIRLFHEACINIDASVLSDTGSVIVRSKPIDGQWYEIVVDESGRIKTFYPTNEPWKF